MRAPGEEASELDFSARQDFTSTAWRVCSALFSALLPSARENRGPGPEGPSISLDLVLGLGGACPELGVAAGVHGEKGSEFQSSLSDENAVADEGCLQWVQELGCSHACHPRVSVIPSLHRCGD